MKMKRYVPLSLVPVLLGSPSPLLAGDIDSSTDPANTLSYTIGAICNRLDTGAAGSQISFTEPTADPAPTGCTLNEMMSKAPVADNTNGAAPSEVANSKTFWGLRTDGTWGQQTGTSTAADTSSGDATAADILSDKKAWVDGSEITGNVLAGNNVSGDDGEKTITIPDALYSGSKTATANDTDLTAGNIKSGVNFFGVAGTYTGIGGNVQNTSSGDATAADIATGKKAWVDGIEITGTASGGGSSSAVAKTGQITTYATGDDGNLEKGVTWPNPRFTDNSNGTVIDNLTGLIWLKNANCFGTKNWTTALSDANSLSSGSCGLTDGSSAGDWRLPNFKELFSLIDAEYYSPALSDAAGTAKWGEGDAFSGVQTNRYWSSTTYADGTTNAWRVGLNGGGVGNGDKSSTNYVWPLRGGQ
jgi:hypothetical protein